MNIPRKGRVSLRVPALLLAFALTACGGADDAGLSGGNADPGGSGASNGRGAGGGGANAGTNTGGGAGTAGGGNAGTGGVSDVPEDCLNGRDDDSDGDVDCADNDCGEVTCVAEAPDGWSGPIAFRDVDAAAADSLSCPEGFPSVAFEVGGDLSARPATCSACECEVTADQCQAYAWESHDGCKTAAKVVPTPIECVQGYDLVGTGRPVGFDAEYVGGCSVTDLPTSLPPAATWGRRALGCAATGVGRGCIARATCVPRADAESRVCVFRDGDHQCTEGYPSRVLRYRGLNDERCETCCGGFAYPWVPVLGGSPCGVALDVYADPACTQTAEPSPRNTPECNGRWGSYYTAIGVAPERVACESRPVVDDPVVPVVGKDAVTICCGE